MDLGPLEKGSTAPLKSFIAILILSPGFVQLLLHPRQPLCAPFRILQTEALGHDGREAHGEGALFVDLLRLPRVGEENGGVILAGRARAIEIVVLL